MEALLISEDTFKEITNVDDNLAGKYVRTAIREAQDFCLQRILGEQLMDKLKVMVNDDTIHSPDNKKYFNLLVNCKHVLAYRAVVQILDMPTSKITNFGVVKATDDHLEIVDEEERMRLKTMYQSKCDAYKYQLQGFLLEHRGDYPELTECVCRRIQSNLKSTASCGIFLGGARGKRIGGC